MSVRFLFRRLTRLLVLAMLSMGATASAQAGDIRFFQLGTGPTGETRFPIGGLIANALSNPPGSRECDRGGSCGVPGLVAVAKSTGGSAANVEALRDKRLDAALVHADIAFWAWHGIGAYKGKPATNLRGIAMLYGESLHVVARRDANIKSLKDLKGKRVSFGEKDSPSAMHGRLLLGAAGLKEAQVKLMPMKPLAAASAMAAGKLDAFLVMDGTPIPMVAELARTLPITLVPIQGSDADRLRGQYPFFAHGEIPGGLYQGVDDGVKTLNVGVALMTAAEQQGDLVRGLTRALWHPSTQRLLADGNPRGKLIHLDVTALDKLGIPMHVGAAAYYADSGTSD